MEKTMENNHECCQCRKKVRDEEEKKNLINRLSRIEGQVRGLKGMVENDSYCTDIITQASAAAAAINSFIKELLVTHIKGCVAEDIRDGREETIDDLVKTLHRLMR